MRGKPTDGKLGKNQRLVMKYLLEKHHRAFATVSTTMVAAADSLVCRSLAQQSLDGSGYRLTAEGRIRALALKG